MEHDMLRLIKDVEKSEKRPLSKGKVVLYGSSYFTRWKEEDLERQFASLGEQPFFVNRAFGTSTSEELWYYFDRLVVPCEPRALCFMEGANDFGQGYTPEEAAGFAVKLFDKARKTFPGIKLIIHSTFFSQKNSPEKVAKKIEYNRILKEYADTHDNCEFLNILPFFFENEDDIPDTSKLNMSLFLPDLVHLNPEGYEKFGEFLLPFYKKYLTI